MKATHATDNNRGRLHIYVRTFFDAAYQLIFGSTLYVGLTISPHIRDYIHYDGMLTVGRFVYNVHIYRRSGGLLYSPAES